MRNSRWQRTLLIRTSIVLHLLALIVVIAEPGQWRWALGAVLANHTLFTLVGLWPRSHWLGPNWTQLPAAATARNKIALTIDDGPDPGVTPQVLDMLDRYAAQATFFCVGEKAARYPDLCREIVRRGHAVENHSQHHRHHFALMGRSGFMRELQAAQDTLTTITGQRPLFFRAPAGLRNPFLDPVLARLELRLASWSARGFDTRIGDVERVKMRLLRGLRAGAILLLHDGNAARTPDGIPVILEVLPTVLAAARAANLRFVTLRQALSMTRIGIAASQGEQALNEDSQQTPWWRQAAAVIPRHVYLKSIGTTLFISLFFGAYFYLLKGPAYPTTVMPITLLDRLIGFQPLALPMYISLWVYVSLPPTLLATRRELYDYGLAMAGTCLAGLIVFYFWPTAVPAADIDWAQYPDVNFLKSMDASGNACPSLHVATAVFSGIWLHHLLRRFGAPLWILILNWAWCIGIVYSALATRQHVAVDVLAGLVLGVLAAGLSLRHRVDAGVIGA